MIVGIFELWPAEGKKEACLDVAGELRPMPGGSIYSASRASPSPENVFLSRSGATRRRNPDFNFNLDFSHPPSK